MPRVVIDPLVWLQAAALLLILPLKWVAAVVLSIAVHEGAHMTSILISGGQVFQIRVGLLGMKIHTEFRSHGMECLSALAGPAGSFLLAFTAGFFPEAALCALIHGLFNLLPVYPLDGGRAVRCLVYMLCRQDQEIRADRIEMLLLTAVMVAAIILTVKFCLGVWLPMIVGIVAVSGLARKIPCKVTKLSLQ